MSVAHWFSTPGCGRSILGSNPGILPNTVNKVKPWDGEQTAHEMPRAKIRSATGSNFKEDDSALFVFLMY